MSRWTVFFETPVMRAGRADAGAFEQAPDDLAAAAAGEAVHGLDPVKRKRAGTAIGPGVKVGGASIPSASSASAASSSLTAAREVVSAYD